MEAILAAFTESVIKAIFFGALAVAGIMAGKKFKDYKDSQKQK